MTDFDEIHHGYRPISGSDAGLNEILKFQFKDHISPFAFPSKSNNHIGGHIGANRLISS